MSADLNLHPTLTSTDEPSHFELKARLDALRVKLHLGGMDAHDKYEALRHDLVQLGRKGSRASRKLAREVLERIEALEVALLIHA